jgi:hypothetical protein
LGAIAGSPPAVQQLKQVIRRQARNLKMNRLLTILLLLGATAHGQIDNPPTTGSIGLGPTNDVTFNRVATTSLGSTTNPAIRIGASNSGFLCTTNGDLYSIVNGSSSIISTDYSINFQNPAYFLFDATIYQNASVGGTLAVTGNVTLSGVNNTATAQTADSASSLMTRSLSDVRYLGEMWHAWRMSAYGTTNIPVGVFKTAPCVLFTNGQSAFYVEAFLDPSKYAGKTVRVLAYCRVDSTNGGNVQGVGMIKYLTNNAGGTDPNFPITIGGQAHRSFGVFTNVSTDVFPVATSTNQYLIFTSNVGTISNNATMIIASFGFDRASTNTTFTNNLYMQAVQVVVENP